MKNVYRLFLIPLLVGLIVAILQFGLPYLFKEKKELTYKINEPITYIEPDKVGALNIVINGTQSASLVSNQFQLENSGQIPLKEIPIRINFSSQDSLFKIYSLSYETLPKFEFGKIKTSIEASSIKLQFELLNPGDKVFINTLTNFKTTSEVYSKSEGMVLNKAETDKAKFFDGEFSFILTLLGSILSTILAFISLSKSLSPFKEIAKLIDLLSKAKQRNELKIISALYGKNNKYVDVNDKLNTAIADNKLNIKITNDIAGDPIHGLVKELKLIYSFGKDIQTIMIGENEILELPINDKNATKL